MGGTERSGHARRDRCAHSPCARERLVWRRASREGPKRGRGKGAIGMEDGAEGNRRWEGESSAHNPSDLSSLKGAPPGPRHSSIPVPPSILVSSPLSPEPVCPSLAWMEFTVPPKASPARPHAASRTLTRDLPPLVLPLDGDKPKPSAGPEAAMSPRRVQEEQRRQDEFRKLFSLPQDTLVDGAHPARSCMLFSDRSSHVKEGSALGLVASRCAGILPSATIPPLSHHCPLLIWMLVGDGILLLFFSCLPICTVVLGERPFLKCLRPPPTLEGTDQGQGQGQSREGEERGRSAPF